MLQFRGSLVTSDAGLLAYRELDDALGLTEMAGDVLADARSGKNGRHAFAGLFRQSVFGRLAGYEDVNDAERLRHDPAMRWIVGGKAAQRSAASPNRMGRFETLSLRRPRTSGTAITPALSRCSHVRSCRSIALPFRPPEKCRTPPHDGQALCTSAAELDAGCRGGGLSA